MNYAMWIVMVAVLAGLTQFVDAQAMTVPATQPVADVQVDPQDRVIAELVLDAQPLGKVLDRLAIDHRLNIVVAWSGLSVDRSAPVSVRLYDVKVSRALWAILASAKGDAQGGGGSLGYRCLDNVFYVGPWDLDDGGRPVRVYDVADLIDDIIDRAPAATLEEKAAEMLATAIQTNVATSTWQIRGGEVGAISTIKGRFIITTTPEIHLAVEALLRDLRGQGVAYPSTHPTTRPAITSKPKILGGHPSILD